MKFANSLAERAQSTGDSNGPILERDDRFLNIHCGKNEIPSGIPPALYTNKRCSTLRSSISNSSRELNSLYLDDIEAFAAEQEKGRRSVARSLASCPSLGVLRLDYNYPAAPGDIDSPDSYDFPVFYRVVPGLTFEVCKSGTLNPPVEKEFDEAVRWLDQTKGVSAITGDCGFMLNLQARARRQTNKPVCMSSLVQLQAILWEFHEGTIIVMTADSASLKPMEELLREECGIELKNKRVAMVGCQDVPYFGKEVKEGKQVNKKLAQPAIVQKALDAVRKHPDTRAILMECTELPPYSNAVRDATGLPVFDSITNCQFVMNSYLENGRFGLQDFYEAWDGKQESYCFGKNLRPSQRSRLLTRLSTRLSMLSNRLSSTGASKHLIQDIRKSILEDSFSFSSLMESLPELDSLMNLDWNMSYHDDGSSEKVKEVLLSLVCANVTVAEAFHNHQDSVDFNHASELLKMAAELVEFAEGDTDLSMAEEELNEVTSLVHLALKLSTKEEAKNEAKACPQVLPEKKEFKNDSSCMWPLPTVKLEQIVSGEPFKEKEDSDSSSCPWTLSEE